MIRDISTNKMCLIGAAILLVTLLACSTWIQHESAEITQLKQDATETEALARQMETSKVNRNKVSVLPLDEDQTQTQNKIAPTPSVETLSKDIVLSKTDTQADIHKDIENDQTVHISPHGLGPYPDVPQGYREACGLTSWEASEMLGLPPPELELELIGRVLVKLWEEGDTQIAGATLENGKVYVTYRDRAYVRYTTINQPDGTTIRYISSWESHESVPAPTLEQAIAGQTPAGIELIDLDVEDPGIEPYSFLNLDQ